MGAASEGSLVRNLPQVSPERLHFSKDRMGARVRAREKSALRSMGSHFRNWAVYSAKSLRENYLRKTGRVGPELPLGAVTAGCVKRAEARFSI